MLRSGLTVAATVVIATFPAHANDATERPSSSVLKAVVSCRALADDASRLACFDAAVAKLEDAQTRKEVVVVDRADMQKTRRSLFGLSMPRLAIFSGDDESDEVKEIEGVISSASQDRDSRWVIALADGGIWQQIDSHSLGKRPRPGLAVKIRKAAFGSYMMNVDGQSAIRVRRDK